MTIKADAALQTRKGFYATKTFTGNFKSDIDHQVNQWFDKLPDEIDGEKLRDWTRLTLVIEQEEVK